MSDHKLFNCSQEYEVNYVANLYTENKRVKEFLIEQCKNGTIKNFTHTEVYALIKAKLGLLRK